MNWGYDHTAKIEGWFAPVLKVEGWYDDEAIPSDAVAPPAGDLPQTVLYMINLGRMGLR